MKKLMLQLFYVNSAFVRRTVFFDSYESLSYFLRQLSGSGTLSNVTITWEFVDQDYNKKGKNNER